MISNSQPTFHAKTYVNIWFLFWVLSLKIQRLRLWNLWQDGDTPSSLKRDAKSKKCHQVFEQNSDQITFFVFFQSLQLEDAAVHSIQTTVYPRKLYEKAKTYKQIWDENGLSNTLAITAFPESAEYLQKTDIFSENLPTFAWCSFTNMTCTASSLSFFMIYVSQ